MIVLDATPTSLAERPDVRFGPQSGHDLFPRPDTDLELCVVDEIGIHALMVPVRKEWTPSHRFCDGNHTKSLFARVATRGLNPPETCPDKTTVRVNAEGEQSQFATE